MKPYARTVGLVCLMLLSAAHNAYSAVRCTNAAGATAYADSAVACPTGYSAAGQVAAMPPVASQDLAQAKAQAARDQTKVDALERQRMKEERVAAKAQFAAQKSSASKAKRCKAAEIALKHAKNLFEDMPRTERHVVRKNSSPNTEKNKPKTHTVVREVKDKAKIKAQRDVEHAQAKRDLACG